MNSGSNGGFALGEKCGETTHVWQGSADEDSCFLCRSFGHSREGPLSDAEGVGIRPVTPDDGPTNEPGGERQAATGGDGSSVAASSKPPAVKTRAKEQPAEATLRDRSLGLLIWYRFVQYVCAVLALVLMRWRAKGQGTIFRRRGACLLVCNHVSFLDVFFVGIPLRRPLNYVARSTLFVPVLGPFIRSVGGFPIQREGIGASGMKETLRRLKAGGIVALFPEGLAAPTESSGPSSRGSRCWPRG